MKLTIWTPTSLAVEVDHIRHLRAEDRTGAFGIAPGHADFLTILAVSVVEWTDADGAEGFALVQGGALMVREGLSVEIAARGAYSESELAALGDTAIDALRRSAEDEGLARTLDARLQSAAMRQIERVMRTGSTSGTATVRLTSPNGPMAAR